MCVFLYRLVLVHVYRYINSRPYIDNIKQWTKMTLQCVRAAEDSSRWK